ncbi:hypothetical protein ACHAXR_002670 [Thalassiosira sp. AJA248-18]
MFVWVAGLEDDDPDKKQKMYPMSRFMHAWASHRLIHGSRGTALGVRGANNKLVGCMSVAPSSCAKERMIDKFISSLRLGMPPNYKEKGKYGPYSQKRLNSLGVLAKAKAKNMKGVKRWIYLPAIGVCQNEHGKGYGKKMLQLLTKTADSLNVPIYLETDSKKNESMYQHFGFHTVEEIEMCIPGDNSPTANFTGYLMRRNPEE